VGVHYPLSIIHYQLNMRRTLLLGTILVGFFLTACGVDTTGLSKDSSRLPHPKSNANGAVLVEEFADLQCPACRAAHEKILKPIVEKYGSDIRYEFRHFPLRTIHRYAMDAAEAAECAADQGKFWDFVDMDFKKQSDLNNEAIEAWAKDLALDMDLFNRCTKSDIKKETILSDYAEGKERGVAGTPTFFVNTEKVDSGLDTIGAAIEKALKGMKQRL